MVLFPYKKVTLVTLLPVTLSFYLDIKYDIDPSLFQRSGSLVVALSLLFSMYNLNKIYKPDDKTQVTDIIHNMYEKLTKKKLEKVKEENVTTFHLYYYVYSGIIGTIIWGYGDLFINLFR